MAKFYYENGYISKPNKSQVARLGLNLFAKNFMNQGGTLTQELKGIVPIRYYKKLVDELRETKEQLVELKDYASKCKEAIEVLNNEIVAKDATIRYLTNGLTEGKKDAPGSLAKSRGEVAGGIQDTKVEFNPFKGFPSLGISVDDKNLPKFHPYQRKLNHGSNGGNVGAS
jgi:hypothetical protein